MGLSYMRVASWRWVKRRGSASSWVSRQPACSTRTYTRSSGPRHPACRRAGVRVGSSSRGKTTVAPASGSWTARRLSKSWPWRRRVDTVEALLRRHTLVVLDQALDRAVDARVVLGQNIVSVAIQRVRERTSGPELREQRTDRRPVEGNVSGRRTLTHCGRQVEEYARDLLLLDEVEEGDALGPVRQEGRRVPDPQCREPLGRRSGIGGRRVG